MRHLTRSLQGPALAALALLCACLDQTSFIQPPPPGSSGDTTSGTVQRAALVVTVPVAALDSALAARIGSPAGVLAEAAVTVEREGSAASRQSDTTEAAGTVTFAGLLPGRYRLAVLRVLTPAETALFDSADADVFAFGGGATVDVQPPRAATAVEVLAGRRGSLVISEVFDWLPLVNGMTYGFAGFLELYNNSDTTIYLGGKLVALGPPYMNDGTTNPSGISCEDGAPYQLDSAGIWSHGIWRIPGGATSYPLLPGKAAVLATDAIDHGPVDARLPDLSNAAFEFIGSNDVDNPAVPNLADVGTVEIFSILGHGAAFWQQAVWYIATAVNLDSLPRAQLPYFSQPFIRIPRATILDVFTSTFVPDVLATINLPLCPALLSPVFDRQPAFLLNPLSPSPGTIVRKAFATLPDGRVILLRTRATANDFERLHVAGTPGTVP